MRDKINRAAKDHGKKFRSELVASFSVIVHYPDAMKLTKASQVELNSQKLNFDGGPS